MATSQKNVGLAVGLAAAAAAAAAGGYWLYGAKDAAKNRKSVRSWMLKARGEVLHGIEKLKEIDKSSYMEIVDSVVKKYAAVKGITTAEIATLARELKGSWDQIQKDGKKGLKAVKKSAAKVRKTSR